MAYTPTEWKDMDIITAEKLNKIEAQLTPLVGTITKAFDANGDPILDSNDNEIYNCDLSYKEIHDAYFAGRNVFIYISLNEEEDGIESNSIIPVIITAFSSGNKNSKTAYTIEILSLSTNTGYQLLSTSETEPMTTEALDPSYFDD